MSSEYDELIALVRELIKQEHQYRLDNWATGQTYGNGFYQWFFGKHVDQLVAWLTAHDAREEVRRESMSRDEVRAELDRLGIDTTEATRKVLAAVRQAESRQAENEPT